MHSNQPIANRYRETAIRTANPLELVVIMYEGVIQSLHEAAAHVASGNIPARARCLNRAISILTELQASLNLSEGGEIAHSLDRLYTYMKQRIFTANLEQKAEPLDETMQLLESLRVAWSEVARSSQIVSTSTEPPSSPNGMSRAAYNTAQMGSIRISG
jgi:flagellar secretion chaperone FliS